MNPLLNWLKRNSNNSLKQQLVHITTIIPKDLSPKKLNVNS